MWSNYSGLIKQKLDEPDSFWPNPFIGAGDETGGWMGRHDISSMHYFFLFNFECYLTISVVYYTGCGKLASFFLQTAQFKKGS
jgi:hypothetical protein